MSPSLFSLEENYNHHHLLHFDHDNVDKENRLAHKLNPERSIGGGGYDGPDPSSAMVVPLPSVPPSWYPWYGNHVTTPIIASFGPTFAPWNHQPNKRLKSPTALSGVGGSSDSLSSNGSLDDYDASSYPAPAATPVRKMSPQFWNHFKTLYSDLVDNGDCFFEQQDNAAGEDVAEGDGTAVVHLLIACAEAVACRDRTHAAELLSDLRNSAPVLGTSFQRVASCFVQGLADRLTMMYPLGTAGIVVPPVEAAAPAVALGKKLEALRLAYELCPYIRFGHFVGNTAILEAFEGESFVHVVDLGMTHCLPGGHQWLELLRSLATRTGTPPPRRVRITGVSPDGCSLEAIGKSLMAEAESLEIPFEFLAIESNLENLKLESFEVAKGEAVAVNSMLQLHCVVKESRGALNSVLQMIHELSPKVLVLVEQDSSHNGPFFLGRFMEALHYYSAIFDSLDAMLPRYDTRRAKVEQFHFAEEIRNIVSCEGPARVERHEKVDQWRRRMSRAGFQPLPVKILAQARKWLENTSNACEGFTVAEEKGCIVLGWKSKPIVAASCWKC